MRPYVATRLTITLVAATLGACGPKGDQLRTVHSYQFATCDSAPTTDPTERAALAAFKDEIETSNFIRAKNTLTVANHEETLEAGGLRQYEGPFYWYLHPGKIDPSDASHAVNWSGIAYLHASKVRFRANGGEWGEWQSVHTRNFGNLNQRSVDGMPRWKCLVGVRNRVGRRGASRNGRWDVEPLAISVLRKTEVRALASATDAGADRCEGGGRADAPAGG